MAVRRAGVIAVWIVAAIAAIAVLILADPADRLIALSLTLAGSILLAFVFQLSLSEKTGFVSRLTSSTIGAFLILVAASLVALVLP